MAEQREELKRLLKARILERQAMAERSKDIQEVQGNRFREGVEDAVTVIPQGITLGGADDLIGLVDKEAGEDYRNKVAQARKRSPVMTFGAEVLSPNPLSKLKIGGRFIKAIATGGATGALESSGDATERAKSAAIGGGLGAASELASLGLGKAFAEPEVMLSNKLNVSAADVIDKTKRLHNPVKVLKDHINHNYKKGLFKGKKAVYNMKTFKWERPKGAGKLTNLGNPNSEELLGRLQDAGGQLNTRADELITSHSVAGEHTFPTGSIDHYVDNVIGHKTLPSGARKAILGKPKLQSTQGPTVAKGVHTVDTLKNEFSDELSSLKERLHQRYPTETKRVDKLIEDQLNSFDSEVGFTAHNLHERKKNIYQKHLNAYKEGNPLDATGTAVEKEMASFYKDVVNSDIPAMKNVNSELENIYSMDKGLSIKTIGDKIGSDHVESLYGSAEYMAYMAAKSVTDPTRMYRAKTAKGVKYVDDSINRALGEGPRGEAIKELKGMSTPMMRLAPQLLKRNKEESSMYQDQGPQSMVEPQQEQDPLVHATFPRTTADVAKHSDSFLAKVQHIEPEHYEQIAHIVQMPPEQRAKVLPQIAEKFPHLFEYDEYHRFDGVVPQAYRPEAIKKIWAMASSNTEKTGLIDKLNRTGELDI